MLSDPSEPGNDLIHDRGIYLRVLSTLNLLEQRERFRIPLLPGAGTSESAGHRVRARCQRPRALLLHHAISLRRIGRASRWDLAAASPITTGTRPSNPPTGTGLSSRTASTKSAISATKLSV